MRLKLAFSFILIFWAMLLVRIYYLSIKSNEYYEEIAEQNVVKSELIAPVRGQILDTKGTPLAINRLGFSIWLAPHLKIDSELEEEISVLTEIFSELNATQIKKDYQKQNSPYNQNFIKVVEFLDYNETVKHFATLNLRDKLKIEPSSQRFYPQNSLASHVIGYVGRANSKDIEKNYMSRLTGYVGRSGVEGFYNEVLQGSFGERKTKVTALNKVVEEISFVPPSSSNIELTIDIQLQKHLREIFKKDAGAAIVMDIKDGAILAAGSFPEYDLNQFVTGISAENWNELINDLNHPFTNKLVNGLYPPGSVIKMAIGMSFINSGKIAENWAPHCSGVMELGGRKFRCWKGWGHGKVNLNDAIRESCDVYFYEGSLIVGIDYMASYLDKMGFGRKSNVDLPNEFVGTVPNKAWKMQKFKRPWYQGETVNASIGQGDILITPMQMAKHTAELASGKGLTPHFLKNLNGEKIEFAPKVLFSPTELSQLPMIRKAMVEVANHEKGTATKVLQGIVVPIAAKTGTAQVVGISQTEKTRMKEADMEYYQRSHAWMTTFGPYENPQYAVTVLVEHGGGGGSAAGPKVKQIYEKLVELGYIKIPEPTEKTDKKQKKRKNN